MATDNSLSSDAPPNIPLAILIAQILGILAPALYSGITYAYSAILIPTILRTNSPIPPSTTAEAERLLATQWHQAYSYGPRFVPPLILLGGLSNGWLAYCALGSPSSAFPAAAAAAPACYALAALLTLAVFPYTFWYMEPGINGASKWKLQRLLAAEAEAEAAQAEAETQAGIEASRPPTAVWIDFEENGRALLPHVARHTAKRAWRVWAEGREMRDLVLRWRRTNEVRWLATAVAAGVSGWVSLRG